MKKYFLIILIFCITIFADAKAFEIIIYGKNAPEKVLQKINQSAELTFKFFKENYNVEFNKTIKLHLYLNRSDYRENIDNYSGGKAISETEIAINYESLKNNNAYVKTISHEIVHLFQRKLRGGTTSNRTIWLSEGSAEVLSSHIVDEIIPGFEAMFMQNTIKRIKNYKEPLPNFWQLESDWTELMKFNKNHIIYQIAFIIVNDLKEKVGIEKLLNFFYEKNYHAISTAKGFETAYGLNYADFTKESFNKIKILKTN